MSPSDFWNLAGRAGRWGKEFQGNIICIDADQSHIWKTYGAPRQRAKGRIERIVDRIAADPAAIVRFIESGTPRTEAAASPGLEQFVSYAWGYWRRYHRLDGFSAGRTLTPHDLQLIATAISTADATLTLPDEVIIRNQGISPIAMHSLLAYFADRGRDARDYMPPPASSNDAVESYVRVLERIDKYLALKIFGTTNPRRYQLALLIVDWMRGYPLSRLISSRIEHLGRKKQNIRLATVIRAVMADVDNVARFLAPKYIGCYIDLLRIYLTAQNETELVGELRDVTLELELGASTKTQMSLMALGLTRTSAMEVAELIADSELDKQGCIAWLSTQKWPAIDLPNLVKLEVEQLLKTYHSFESPA